MCIRRKNKPTVDRLLIDLLIDNIFFKLILPLNFKMEGLLNKGLVWKFRV